MVWDPARIAPKPWASVVEFYADIVDRNHDYVPLHALAGHVLTRPYAGALFAATSGTTLLVMGRSDASWVTDALRIDVALNGSIRYTPPESRLGRPAAFAGEPERLIATFERLVRKERWIAP